MDNISKLRETIAQVKNDIHNYNLDTPDVIQTINTLEKNIEAIEEKEKNSWLVSMKKTRDEIIAKKKELRELEIHQTSLKNKILGLTNELQSSCKHWEVTKNNDYDGHNTHRYFVCNECNKYMNNIGSESRVVSDIWYG